MSKVKKAKKLTADSAYVYAEMAIGEKKGKYIDIFKRITQGELIIPSLWAGLFGLAWLMYRRATYYGFIVYAFLVFISFNVVDQIPGLSKSWKMILIFGFTHLVFYFVANFIYWYSVRKKVDNYRNDYGDISAMTYLGEQGGTTLGVTLIASVFLLQGGAVLLVYGVLSADLFFANLWQSILEVANIKDSLVK